MIDDGTYATSAAVDQYVLNLTRQIYKKVSSSELSILVKQYAGEAGFLSAHQSLSDYALSADVPKNVSQLSNDCRYMTESRMSEYAKLSDISGNISRFDNDVGYLSAHQSLSGYYTKAEAAAALSGKITILSSANARQSDLSVVHLTRAQYKALATKDQSSIYIVDDDQLDAANKTVQNVANPVLATDAVPFGVVSGLSGELKQTSAFIVGEVGGLSQYISLHGAMLSNIPTNNSQLVNDSRFVTSSYVDLKLEGYQVSGNYLSAHQSLSDYTKTADLPTDLSAFTNSPGFISAADLTAFYTKA